ncbi:shikimate dehydrogenase [Formosa sp. Hel1_33_131]|jgi:shikimate dehydrogenase|uniref:shikimate dehydrogenase family protein n=1 Tax=Formosa sp. Hel1_33_131 TaxID=1336794 RepID=UPI00084E2F02|nr:shikimate dehydrogenase [Formosa sp. Hel1_33_131]AOR27255.1 shikimate dehydrogenase [Formosa sp. Hel1_33_131]
MKNFGLLGKNIDYSFSRGYFKDKFETNKLDCTYNNFDLEAIEDFESLKTTETQLSGLNVTIPYKQVVLPYLDAIDSEAQEIGAVNTIKIENGRLTGYNTDHFGFENSLKPHLKSHHKRALILGTGGASKAVAFALKKLGIHFEYVSRTPSSSVKYSYESLAIEGIENYQIIINCTPLGTFPDVHKCPTIPYEHITSNHLLFDLIYNPEETLFLKHGNTKNATTLNGLEMLRLQAEKSWEIWNS